MANTAGNLSGAGRYGLPGRIFDIIYIALGARAVYYRSLAELRSRSDAELAAMGTDRSQIHSVALQKAFRD